MSQKKRQFTREFKLQVVRDVEAGKSIAQAAREHQFHPTLIGNLQWPGLEQVFKIEREVEEISTGKKRSVVSYGISSLSRREASAERLLEIVRGHWGIESVPQANRKEAHHELTNC
jgi:hypothetical protein